MKQIHLQGIGLHDAVPVNEIKPGDVIIWNFGFSSRVIRTQMSKTGKSVTIETEAETRHYTRRYNANTLLAIHKQDPKMELIMKRLEYIRKL